jgi:hypothetical protein
MFKYLSVVLVVLAFLPGCKKDSYQLYKETQNNVYFDFATQRDRDSVTYTFAYTPDLLSDTFYLPVRIAGNRVSHVQTYKVMVMDSGTTAKPGLDYAPLKDSYTIAADSGFAWLPVVLLNNDSALTKHSVALNLRLVSSSDLGVALPDVITARILISNKLEKPSWWDTWGLTNYSDEKYQLYIIGSGGRHDLPTGNNYGLYAPQALYYIGLMNQLITDPLGWLAEHPGEGYVLQQQPDGTYYFYNTATPANRIAVIFDTTNNTYYFVQKAGGFVTPN